jgi:hypothetical protein
MNVCDKLLKYQLEKVKRFLQRMNDIVLQDAEMLAIHSLRQTYGYAESDES